MDEEVTPILKETFQLLQEECRHLDKTVFRYISLDILEFNARILAPKLHDLLCELNKKQLAYQGRRLWWLGVEVADPRYRVMLFALFFYAADLKAIRSMVNRWCGFAYCENLNITIRFFQLLLVEFYLLQPHFMNSENLRYIFLMLYVLRLLQLMLKLFHLLHQALYSSSNPLS